MDSILKIVIVEDSREDVFLIERELKAGGIAFTSCIVDNKSQFENALHEIKPDVILSDHTLPQFNSIEALKIHQQFQSETNIIIPFILITGSVSEEFAARCIKSGADDYILKDRLTRLPAAVRNAFKKSRMERERLRFIDAIISNEAMMREAEQLAHFGSWQFDLVTGKHTWSDETYRVLGYEPGGLQATYETFLNHIHPDERQFIEARIDSMIDSDSLPCEFRIIDNTGKVKHILSNILVKRNQEQHPVQLLGFILDITEQKKQNEVLALQNMQLMEIAWIQSHEVRGPLARLMGLIHIMECYQDNENHLKEFLKPILESAHELDAVIRKIVRKTEAMNN